MKNNYLVFDVGGTCIKYCIFDKDINILESETFQTPNNLATFTSEINKIIDKYSNTIQGVSFSIPGRVNQRTSTIYGGGALNYLHEKVLKNLLHIDGMYFSMENDAKCGALAELWTGNLNDVEDGALLTLGSGIGGGIILNSKLYRGVNYSAGEISIMRTQFEFDFKDIFGFRGSAVNMIAQINKNVLEIESLDGYVAFDKILEGNKVALELFNDFSENIALVIFNMQTILDLQRVVISGGISRQPIVIETINKKVEQLFGQHDIIQNTISKPEIVSSGLRDNANLYGALYNLLLNIGTIPQK